ncbi:class-II fumarase/aspartase family protein [Flindersiella endophytica]
MLEAEAALVAAQAEAGLVPADAAERIARTCRELDLDVAALGVAAAEAGTPVVPLVKDISAAVSDADADYVHLGATSQDIVDTAMMLVVSRNLQEIRGQLETSAEVAAGLAATHRRTVMAGRTLLQQAAPTTFGLLAAGWLAGLDSVADHLLDVRENHLAVQLGGAVGTLASLEDRGLSVLAAYSSGLGLAEPAVPWHTERSRVAQVACALGEAAGVAGKIARDVVLLSQNELGEVHEARRPGRGGSSTLPHKRNPVAAVTVSALAQQAPGLVATLLSAMPHELQRAAGAWQAEWGPLDDLLQVVHGAADSLRECLSGLEVDTERMRANVDAGGSRLLAEALSTGLRPVLGRRMAQRLVTAAGQEAVATGVPVASVLAGRPEISLSRGEIEALQDPMGYLGAAEAFVDRALAAHDERRNRQ